MFRCIKVVLVFICVILAQEIQGQSLDALVLKNTEPNCADISGGSARLFSKYIAGNNLDSAKVILDYWTGKCEAIEPLVRATVQLSLITNTYSDSILTENSTWYLINYINRNEAQKDLNNSFFKTSAYYGFVPIGEEFDQVLKRKFNALKTDYDQSSMEYLLADFYSNPNSEVFNKLETSIYNQSQVAESYLNDLKSTESMSEAHMSFFTGLWLPTKELRTLGNHPEVGFSAGWKKGSMNYDFLLSFKFLKAKNDYLAYRKESDVPESTDHFFGGKLGFEVGKDIYQAGKHELQLIAGLALDGFDILEEDESRNLEARSIVTYNVSLGLGYRVYTNGHFYLGLKGTYNLVDYTINNAIRLDGNAFTLHLTMGSVNNIFKSSLMKTFGKQIRR